MSHETKILTFAQTPSLGSPFSKSTRYRMASVHSIKYLPNMQIENYVIFAYITCILLLSKFFYSPTDAQVSCLKNNIKIYIKIYIKTAPTCFCAVTPSSGSAILETSGSSLLPNSATYAHQQGPTNTYRHITTL